MRGLNGTGKCTQACPLSPKPLPELINPVRHFSDYAGRQSPRRKRTNGAIVMSEPSKPIRCAIYTRKSSEEGLEQNFNSLDAQREACSAYIQRTFAYKLRSGLVY